MAMQVSLMATDFNARLMQAFQHCRSLPLRIGQLHPSSCECARIWELYGPTLTGNLIGPVCVSFIDRIPDRQWLKLGEFAASDTIVCNLYVTPEKLLDRDCRQPQELVISG